MLDFLLGRQWEKIKFWKDKWCSDGYLCDSFPSLSALPISEEDWMGNLWMHSNERDIWIPKFL